MKLSKNFSLAELIKSSTANRGGIDNSPEENHVSALKSLCVNVLQPIRDHFGRPVVISSGYRCHDLEKALYRKKVARIKRDGGDRAVSEWLEKKSHPKGEAADIEIPGIDNKYLFEWVRDNLAYDQLFLEFYKDGDPNSGWVHVSWSDTRENRNHSNYIG